MKAIKEKLIKDIQYSKNSHSKNLMYEVLGKIKMAFELNAITKEEYFELDHMIVYDGLNNPEFIKIWNQEYFNR